MYESFFKLAAKPFDLVPNPDFLFLSRSHKRALTYLDYGIRERAGFILITGEVGSGKTTILRDLVKKHANRLVLSKIFNTRVTSEQLISLINDDFGLPVQGRDKITLLRELNAFLIDQFASGNQPVLIIDEAQNLTADLLEEVRMLSNLEADNAKLLQIILAGQPELRKTLAAPEMRQLRQRISINCVIRPLTHSETEQYILHRLEKAGNRDAVSFSSEALALINRYSRGVPRLINIICDFLMLAAFAEDTRKLDGDMVRDIARDLDFENHFWVTGAAKTEEEGNPSETAVFESSELASSLIDLSRRLDTLEQESAKFQQTIIREAVDKIEALQKSLDSHVEVNDAVLSELAGRVHEMQYSGGAEVSPASEEKNPKGGFLRWMFGP